MENMPELPEVEVTRRGLLPAVAGRVVQAAWTSRLPLRATVSAARLKRHLLGGRIVGIDRRAKYLLFRFAGGAVLVLHLGMSGKLSLLPAATPRRRHDHLELALAAERQTPLKSFLMNSRLIAGIGNIYANEILFAAGLHPERPAATLQAPDWAGLIHESRRILEAAIQAGGATIADFLGADGHPGYFQLQLQVYGKSGESCPSCGTPLSHTVLAGRSTWFCPHCQPRFR